MKKILIAVKHEFFSLLPVYIFFFIASEILFLSKTLILESYGIHFAKFATSFVEAIIYTKVVLIMDQLKFTKIYEDKPLIYNSLWRTLLYFLCALWIVYLEHIMVGWIKYKSFVIANIALWHRIIWPQFCLAVIWVLTLLFVFCSFLDLIRYIGPAKFRALYLGIK